MVWVGFTVYALSQWVLCSTAPSVGIATKMADVTIATTTEVKTQSTISGVTGSSMRAVTATTTESIPEIITKRKSEAGVTSAAPTTVTGTTAGTSTTTTSAKHSMAANLKTSTEPIYTSTTGITPSTTGGKEQSTKNIDMTTSQDMSTSEETTVTTTQEPECKPLSAEDIEAIMKQLTVDEGLSYQIYIDSEGHPTFGIGHKITKDDQEFGKPVGTKVTRARIEAVFKADMKAAIKNSKTWCADFDCLPSEAKKVIVNMMFNLGLGSEEGKTGMRGFVKFREAIKKRDWATAAKEMGSSKWRRQVKGRAKRLIKRVKALDKD